MLVIAFLNFLIPFFRGVAIPPSVDLHRSKALISLVPFNLPFHCFQG